MKRFIFSILCVSVFFIGLGGLIQQAGAKFKSDERAVTLINQARIAIGGDANINSVKSFSAKGKVTHIFNFTGADKAQEGDFEMNLALPNQFSKMVKFRVEATGAESAKNILQEDNKVIIVKHGDGNLTWKTDAKDDTSQNIETTPDGKTFKKEFHVVKNGSEMHSDELMRTMLGLFLTPPEGVDVEYSYVGGGNVDGNDCEIVEAKKGNDSIVKIYLSKSTNLPLMMSYRGLEMPPKITSISRDNLKPANSVEKQVRVIVPQADANSMADINVKFSDYRSVNGLLLPFVWTKTANNEQVETVKIDNYEINPSNITEKFNRISQKIYTGTEKKR